ncbi:MAG: hypothetical protein ACREFC_13015, partial [Stellaceae bacterium]
STSFISTNTGGDAGSVNIVTTGAVDIAYDIFAVGGTGTEGAKMGNGGSLTIRAGGSITIGSAIPLMLGGSPRSIETDGAQIVSAEQTPGNGGAITLSGASIALYQGASSTGGDADLEESTSTGGTGGAITLTATGAVTIGSATTGDVVGLSSHGGFSLGGTGGDGGDISVTGDTIAFAAINAAGGQTSGGTLGNGGDITLTATATSGAAVTIYGEADDALTTDVSQIQASFALSTGGATSGNITIQGGVGGASLLGTAFVQLVDNSVNAGAYGGATVEIAALGSPGHGGTISINGPIEGTSGTENLRLFAEDGQATITGKVGDQTPLNHLVLGCCGVDESGTPN